MDVNFCINCNYTSHNPTKKLIFPFDLQLAMLDPLYTAIPALSYPRYSSLLSPFKIIGKESLFPKYPTIPHIIILNLFFNFLIELKININYNF